MTKSIPQELEKFIDKYFHLQICGLDIESPYYMSTGGFLKKPVFAGKADPYLIEKTANQVVNKFQNIKKQDVIKEMESINLGIDCSGFTYQVINFWLNQISKKGELKNYLPKVNLLKFRKYYSRKFKPQSSVSADMFTSEPIASKIELKEIEPGDLIRTRGGKHVLFVYKVDYEKDIPRIIYIVHSQSKYNKKGVIREKIELGNDLNLLTAKWSNDLNEEKNETYLGFRVLSQNNGAFRLNLPLREN